MPVVLRSGKFRFFFYSNENNEPVHIHIESGGKTAKFWLDPLVLQANYGFNRNDMKKISKIVKDNKDQLMEAWDEYFDN